MNAPKKIWAWPDRGRRESVTGRWSCNTYSSDLTEAYILAALIALTGLAAMVRWRRWRQFMDERRQVLTLDFSRSSLEACGHFTNQARYFVARHFLLPHKLSLRIAPKHRAAVACGERGEFHAALSIGSRARITKPSDL